MELTLTSRAPSSSILSRRAFIEVLVSFPSLKSKDVHATYLVGQALQERPEDLHVLVSLSDSKDSSTIVTNLEGLAVLLEPSRRSLGCTNRQEHTMDRLEP